jgi:hypothetical protein
MTDIIPSIDVDVHPSIAELTLLYAGNCFIIASPVSKHGIWQILLRMVADSTSTLFWIAFYNCCSSMFDVAFPRIFEETSDQIS